jgi:hypothetical protein
LRVKIKPVLQEFNYILEAEQSINIDYPSSGLYHYTWENNDTNNASYITSDKGITITANKT